MNQQTKQCQNCKKDFTIEPEDFQFYEKINVPPPTFCPECRMQRRFAWRNERTLHRVVCAATGKPIISGFKPDANYVVYDRDYWWSDDWNPLTFGQDYESSRSFFEQFDQLMHHVPHPAVFNSRTVNCDYTQHTGEYKDGYLASAGWGSENVAYASRCSQSKDCMDAFELFYCTLAYEDVSSVRLYNTHFSFRSENCSDSWFVFDCKSCNNCFGCWNLRNKSYHIFNKPYSKEEYKKKIKEFDLGSFSKLEEMKKRFQEIKLKALHKYGFIINSYNSTGDNLENVQNCKNCFTFSQDSRDCKYCLNGGFKINDAYDGYGIGAGAELMYETFDSGVQGSRLLFVSIVYGCNSATYCYNCTGGSNLFGCVGLRNRQYCILNKQYSKEDYEKLRNVIVNDMIKNREYGEFFPASISPFGYNETVAQDYFPLTKEKALSNGYKWQDREVSEHKVTIKAKDLPDHIKDTTDEILKEVIECSSCHRIYRIIQRELQFLKRFNIALPRKCFECRHYDRFHQGNFPRLYHRQCSCDYKVHQNTAKHSHHPEGRCPNKFHTSYDSNRPEIVYCEECYNKELA